MTTLPPPASLHRQYQWGSVLFAFGAMVILAVLLLGLPHCQQDRRGQTIETKDGGTE